MHQALQFASQAAASLIAQFKKAEGLKTALCSPHRKHHAGTAAHRGHAKMEHHGHGDALIERIGEREQAAIRRQLAESGANLTAVFEQHQSKNRTAEFDARAALPFSCAGGGCHIPRQYRTAGNSQADYESSEKNLVCCFGMQRGKCLRYAPVLA